MLLSFEEARQLVVRKIADRQGRPFPTLSLPLSEALGFVLAQEVQADRDYPALDRSTRDGYAVRSSEAAAGASLRCVGEIKAGDTVTSPLASGTCIQIMTGAAVPPGADAVVMIEFTERNGDEVTFHRASSPGQNFVQRGSEARMGDLALHPGLRLGYAELAVAAQVGAAEVCCFARPRVAILSTGDEVV